LLPAAHSLASRKCCYHTSSGNSRDLTVPKFQVMYFQKRKSQSQFLHSCERLMLIYSQSMLGWFPDPFLLEEESSRTVVIAVDVSRGCVNKYEELTAASTPCCLWLWGGLILVIKTILSKYNTVLLGKPLQVQGKEAPI